MSWSLPLRYGDRMLASSIVGKMREWDRREIFATRANDDTEQFLDDVMNAGPVKWIAGREDLPIAIYGCKQMWPGVWSMWFFATDNFGQIGLSVTRRIVRSIVPMLFANGAHRLECRSMEGHDDAHKWLEQLGASYESTLKGYGRGGEHFRAYAWVRR